MKNPVKTNDIKKIKQLIESTVVKEGKGVKISTKTKLTDLEKQKRTEEMKAIRELNPAFNRLVGKNNKLHIAELRAQLVPNLLECKRQFNFQKIKNSDFDNELYLNECSKTLNFFLSKKGEQYIAKFEEAVTKRKGNFGTYDSNGLIGKLVKAKQNGEKSYNVTLNKVIEDKELREIKKANKLTV